MHSLGRVAVVLALALGALVVAGCQATGEPPTPPATVEPTLELPTQAAPTVAQPTLAQPTLAQPTLAQPTLAQPTVAQPTQAATDAPTTAAPGGAATDPPPTTVAPPPTMAPPTAAPATTQAGPAGPGAERIALGEGLYARNCAVCHGANGQGTLGGAPALLGHEDIVDDNPGSSIRQVIEGGDGMPAYGDRLSDEEIAAIISYVRNAWGQSGSLVEAAAVASERADLADDDDNSGRNGGSD